nr:AzlC family ABC transporter permease [uncultured Butyrivibrio sp.]
MIGKYRDAGAYKPYLIFALTDKTYSLLCDDDVSCVTDINYYRFFVSLFNHCYWVTGTVIGSILGKVLPFSTRGIEFSMTALFIASFTEQWLTSKDHMVDAFKGDYRISVGESAAEDWYVTGGSVLQPVIWWE